MNSLQQLQQHTTIVADTGDLTAIAQFRPLDATTNPSLITAAAKQVENQELIAQAYQQAQQEGYQGDALIERTIDRLTVALGVKILDLIDGRVSTEVDAELSFDTAATIAKAKQLLALYQHAGIAQERILIKIASTWQGIQAAKQLEAEGIHCNLTLLFGLHQAQACADAKVTLISPFVGRILDWYKKAHHVEHYDIEQDPGVRSVQQIYNYYKQNAIQTQVMGASFRSTAQVKALAGCDLLTIAPALLQQLEQEHHTVTAQLSPALAQNAAVEQRAAQTEQSFHDELQADAMAHDLLHAGIDGFIQAKQQLKALLIERFA
ncbi:MAG: transaldolase [Acinetobacter sp.]|nr:transaldolase [Acinetobacter sp.]